MPGSKLEAENSSFRRNAIHPVSLGVKAPNQLKPSGGNPGLTGFSGLEMVCALSRKCLSAKGNRSHALSGGCLGLVGLQNCLSGRSCLAGIITRFTRVT